MYTITLTGTIGDNQFLYTAVMPFKSGWTEWDLFIGDLYQGKLLFQRGAWNTYLVPATNKNSGTSWLTSEDIQIFIEEIEKIKDKG